MNIKIIDNEKEKKCNVFIKKIKYGHGISLFDIRNSFGVLDLQDDFESELYPVLIPETDSNDPAPIAIGFVTPDVINDIMFQTTQLTNMISCILNSYPNNSKFEINAYDLKLVMYVTD